MASRFDMEDFNFEPRYFNVNPWDPSRQAIIKDLEERKIDYLQPLALPLLGLEAGTSEQAVGSQDPVMDGSPWDPSRQDMIKDLQDMKNDFLQALSTTADGAHEAEGTILADIDEAFLALEAGTILADIDEAFLGLEAGTFEQAVGSEDGSQSEVGARWREIQGNNSWRGLLSPRLDPLLGAELIRYGKLVQTCYASFSSSEKTTASFKSSSAVEVAVYPNGYEDVRILYTDTGKRNRIGFLAVSDPEQSVRLGRTDIVVVFRGSKSLRDWFENFQYGITGDKTDYACGVARGFQKLTEDFLTGEVQTAILESLERLETLKTHRNIHDLSITFVGHSLGAALAVTCAKDVAEANINCYFPDYKIPITVFSLASPKVGNRRFKKTLEELGVSILRVVHKYDLLRSWPPSLNLWFVHVGAKLKIGNSTSLNRIEFTKAHSLDEYLRCLERESKPITTTDSTFRDLYNVVRYFTTTTYHRTGTNRLNEGARHHSFLPHEKCYMWIKRKFFKYAQLISYL